MPNHTKYIAPAILIFVVATVDAVGALSGYWSESGDTGPILWAVKGCVLLSLVVLSFAIKNWVVHNTTNLLHRKIAGLSLASLVVCVGGDIINANFSNTFYHYGDIVKHDYLAESVLFFGPGYFLLLLNGVLVAKDNKVKASIIYLPVLVATLLGVVSLFMMHLPGTGTLVTAITGSYAALISAVGIFGFVIIYSFGGLNASPRAWLVGLGFMLAGVADAVIGNFWIYGNEGKGFYPTVRHVNWILYIGSQCLVIYLPFILVLHNKHLTSQVSRDSSPGDPT